ncbi:hypothetical protein [Martelella sp. HB161492]|uniref:hypothetical protein n=1 Tax=Martelella sp. HB161492 TaxID=2720726 RepID=UPI001FEFFD3B|nr:hypothetical protein [Martelella sp. HB161492]
MDFCGPCPATIARIRSRLTGLGELVFPVTPSIAMTSSAGVAAQNVAGVQPIFSEPIAIWKSVRI